MTTITQLYPQPLWQWFDQICAIPHPSKHEAALSAHIQAWAKEKGLDVEADRVGNLIIRKPATAGMENRKTVAIQAHLDMVPQKNDDKVHNFETDAIMPRIDGDWVKATGTTLGADNGIGMASALALLGSTDIAHGPLEVLLTIDEEAGMTGAFGLEAGKLQADILINTDSEQEGEIYMGCAGGVDAAINLPLSWTDAAPQAQAFELKLSGLKGGHSGVNIHLGRGNANKLLARFLFGHGQQLQLAGFTGGTLRNAIPREASCRFVIASEHLPQLQADLATYQQILSAELASADADVTLTLVPADMPQKVMTSTAQQQFIALMHACPNGVMRMSDEVEGVVETSLNLGVVSLSDNEATLLCLIRSLIDTGREELEGRLAALVSLTDGKLQLSGAYPGWKPDNSSEIMAIVRDTYQDMYHKAPDIMVIHAGLECGLFKKPYPLMDMVSVGPTIRFPHSPDEMVNIATVGHYWDLMLEVLKRIPAKA
ncbi:aminoacyl-histidine dipeptidase [Shewanella sp. NFH-SH190041]|uniref:aminoacyl-histidine dipeptidase n=1 Tax=Shewanella sp. NFH-SH190041 TaxID=2950245 RepID=UPI0021C3D297|nr:aminoacyl-histidine dipeptidase [Shewanella sp. NFH-SH190041]BDM63364.1 aminoacyl-histidine dipeptidase [Shewanella sp. NFH-SH190041]